MIIKILAVALIQVVSAASEPPVSESVRQNWIYPTRVELETPGGPLPFVIEVAAPPLDDSVESEFRYYGEFPLRLSNGAEEIVLIETFNGSGGGYGGLVREATIEFDQYGSWLRGTGSRGCVEVGNLIEYMRVGNWVKKRGGGVATVPYRMIEARSKDDRFDPVQDAGEAGHFGGRWSVKFETSDDLAIGEFDVDDNQIASGTFMTTTGDYRFLAGRVDGNLMRLSTFDGAHAFLFHARMQDDGTIEGDFWSGNWWHETWTAVRDDDAVLPDAFEQTTIADEDALDDMVFKNLQGEPTRVLDVLDESNAPARIIEIFGTWCPNCSDAGRELVSLREQYGDDLAVVGLAFEVTEDFERSVQQVRHHHEHIGTDWPILIAGLSDKAKASQALPVLDKVRSYPTLIFLDRNNEVQGVYSGFSGPATGDAYTKQRERFEALIESMID